MDEQSAQYPVKWGLPQGSTLGLILFLIYINNLIASTLIILRMFADDTCLCFIASTTENLIEDINTELKHVHDWITASKLCINAQSYLP